MVRDGPANGARPPASGANEAADRWHQSAGFSVFFDSRSALAGELRSRTRLYHEESAEETTFPGSAPTAWVRWMLDRVGSAQPLSEPMDGQVSLVSMEIIEARMVGDPKDGGDDCVSVEFQVRVTGLDELHRALGARVVAVLFGPELE
jgi:hypothetical protein